MKTLYLVRHAKSSWDCPDLEDTERPLNSRGKHDAPLMGKLLKKMKEEPDKIISGHAKRAFSTARRIAEEIGYPKKNIEEDERLYMAGSLDFVDVISGQKKNVNSIMLFSHNPGITSFANSISNANIENIPTCGIVKIDFDINKWNEISEAKGKMIYFEYPKKHYDGKL